METRKHQFGILLLLLFCNAWQSVPGQAGELSDLYRASVIVTGEREETRLPGVAQAFGMVMSKVSGDPDIASNPAFASWSARSRGFVWSYAYHDRLFGRPIHDEQGTRDRPFDLTVQFDQKMVDTALLSLNEKPWPKPRLKLAIIIRVHDMMRNYLLSKDGEFGTDQRASFEDASDRYGVPIVLPTKANLAMAHLNYQNIISPNADALKSLAREIGADAVLLGSLEWSPPDHGWIGNWHMSDEPEAKGWAIRGVNFDAAFRDAIGGAARRLSLKSH